MSKADFYVDSHSTEIPQAIPTGEAPWHGDKSPAPPGLVLVSATYLPSAFAPRLTLSFDRPIDIAALVGSAIVVTDGTIEQKVYTATGSATMLDANTVRITLVETTTIAGLSVTLTATNASGIVAVDDGGIWNGVDGLELPFP